MRSLQRQRKMYIDGFAGITPAIPVSYAALEAKARRILSPEAFAYLAGGAGNELTIRANQLALESVKIHPHMLGGVQEVSMIQKWRAHTLPAPFMLAPIGVLELAHPQGDLAVARACQARQIPMIMSSQASNTMEAIAAVLGDTPRSFQLYHSKSDDVSKSFIQRAERINAQAIIVTLDTTMLGWRTRDLALGYSPFIFAKGIAQYTSDPAFNALPDPEDANPIKPSLTMSLLQNLWSINHSFPGSTFSNLRSGKALKTVRKFTSIFNNPGINWDDIGRIKEWTSLPVYLKGILRPDDALKAISAGVDGIIVSNHGGRQIDGSVGSVEALVSILNVTKGKLDTWVDSGIRSGSDVYKCIALGATGVLIGRPYAMALACGGTQGVIDCIDNIMAELELNMILSGCSSLSSLHSSLISHPWNTH
jgi:lactate 2-monooxygenase